jgi:hypothetical protein
MKIKEGDIIRRVMDGIKFTVTKVKAEWVVLKSENGTKEIMTSERILSDKSMYQKKEDLEDDTGCY